MNSFSTHVQSRGFTLVEVLVVLALSVSLLTALSLLIYEFNTTYAFGQAAARSEGSLASLMREAESLAPGASEVLASHDFAGTTYTSGPATLVLQLPSVDASGNAIAGAYDYAVLYADGTYAYRILAADATSARVSGTKQLSDTLSALTFSYDNADFALVKAVSVDAHTSTSVKGRVSTDERYEQLFLRNH